MPTDWPRHVNVINDEDIIYISGDADTDGSIRMMLESGDTCANIESRASGVWNDTSFRFGSGSVEIGRDLHIEAAADFIKTFNPSGFGEHSIALIPHVPFSDSGTLQLHSPIADLLADLVVFSTAVSEVSGTTISQSVAITTDQFIKNIKYEVGTVGASSEVQHTIYQGTDNTGSIISRMNLPASDFVSETTATVDVESSIGFSELHADIFIEITSDTSFTLKTDVSGNILVTFESQKADVVGIFTENIIYNNNFDHILDSSLNPIYGNQF